MDKTISQFTRKQISNWRKYEKVRASGRWNMWDIAAMEATGMNRREYLFVLRNYDALKEEVGL